MSSAILLSKCAHADRSLPVQLYLALSGVLTSGGSEVLSALAAAEAELASIGPDAAKSKVWANLRLRTRQKISHTALSYYSNRITQSRQQHFLSYMLCSRCPILCTRPEGCFLGFGAHGCRTLS